METKTKIYTLVLSDTGDITIVEESLVKIDDIKVAYHKSYCPEDRLKGNLLKALEVWEDLQKKALNEKPKVKR